MGYEVLDVKPMTRRIGAEVFGLDLGKPLSNRQTAELREAVLGSGAQPAADLWPLFDALKGLPLCALRGAGSDLLSPETFAQMTARRPDMIAAEIPGRGHVPFLDEPAALDALARWLRMLG